MWVDFNEYELPPELATVSPIKNPETGCPLYQTCYGADGLPTGPDANGDCAEICAPSQIYVERTDQYNTGFCLEYSLAG